MRRVAVKIQYFPYLFTGQRHIGQKSVQNISTLGLRRCQCCLVVLQSVERRAKRTKRGKEIEYQLCR